MSALTAFLAVTILFGGGVFMATYVLLAPWWRSETGRNIMTLTAGITGLALLRVLAFFLGDGYPGQMAVRVVLLAAVAIAIWWRWTMLLRVQLGRREVDRHEEQGSVDLAVGDGRAAGARGRRGPE